MLPPPISMFPVGKWALQHNWLTHCAASPFPCLSTALQDCKRQSQNSGIERKGRWNHDFHLIQRTPYIYWMSKTKRVTVVQSHRMQIAKAAPRRDHRWLQVAQVTTMNFCILRGTTKGKHLIEEATGPLPIRTGLTNSASTSRRDASKWDWTCQNLGKKKYKRKDPAGQNKRKPKP